MARRLRIEWSPGQKVTGRLVAPPAPPGAVLLAHGAGAGQDHEFMTYVRDGLAKSGWAVMTFDYPYIEAGRSRPDRTDRLLQCHRAAADRLAERYGRVVLGGKSMGGRIGSHLAGDEAWPAAGLVYLGYPLVPMGTGAPRDTSHLERISAPQLFLAGTRDRLSPPELIEPLAARLAMASAVVIDEADHSFRVPKRTGLSPFEVLDGVVDIVTGWLARL